MFLKRNTKKKTTTSNNINKRTRNRYGGDNNEGIEEEEAAMEEDEEDDDDHFDSAPSTPVSENHEQDNTPLSGLSTTSSGTLKSMNTIRDEFNAFLRTLISQLPKIGNFPNILHYQSVDKTYTNELIGMEIARQLHSYLFFNVVVIKILDSIASINIPVVKGKQQTMDQYICRN
jgi:hypothetical protein